MIHLNFVCKEIKGKNGKGGIKRKNERNTSRNKQKEARE